MASPFKVFRKHQKVLLAVLGLMAMISFVVLPALLDMLSVSRVRDPVVVRTSRYGDLLDSQVSMLDANHQRVYSFLQRIAQAVQAAGGNPQPALTELRRIGLPGEESAVHGWLMARRAEELGMVVTDAAINQYLTRLATAQGMAEQQVRRIMASLGLSETLLYDLLRQELLALRLQEVFLMSLEATTPGQRWDHFKRLNLKARLELAAIPVSNYIDQVPDPTDEELRAFFEKYRNRLDDPRSPEPGFRIPKKIALAYVKIDHDTLIDPESVSDAEVEAHYRQNIDLYRRPSSETTEGEGGEATATETEAASPSPGLGGPGESGPPAESATEGDQAAAAGEPQDEDPGGPAMAEPEERVPETGTDSPPGTGTPEPGGATGPPEASGRGPEQATPAGDRPGAPTADRDVPEPGPAVPGPGSADQSRSPVRAGVFRLTAFGQDPGEEPDDAALGSASGESERGGSAAGDSGEPAGAPRAAGAETEAPAAGAGQPLPDESAAESAPPGPEGEARVTAEAPPAAAGAAAEEEGEGASPQQLPEGEAPAPEEREDGQAPDSEYIPLEEVRDQIRRSLAGDRATKAKEQVVNRLRDRMDAFYQKWIAAQGNAEGMSALTRPDLGQMLQQVLSDTGMTGSEAFSVHRTGLISAVEALGLDIGESKVSQQIEFVQFAYRSLGEYQPEWSQDLEGNEYLFWKLGALDGLQETEERVPEFEEVRGQVEAAWRAVRARDIARRDAEQLAVQARKSDGSLAALLEDRGLTVVETEPFTWNMYGTLPYYYYYLTGEPPRVSQVQQKLAGEPNPGEKRPQAVRMPGDEFMRAVFHPKDAGNRVREIRVGDIGVATNSPQDTVYVYRVIELSPSMETLREQFFRENYDRYRQIGIAEMREAQASWFARLQASAGLRWEREPRRGRQG